MARVRNNQGYRKKVLDIFIRPFLEQENTQERESYLQERESIKPLQDKTWKLASNIVGRFTHLKTWKWLIIFKTNFQT